MRHFVTILGLLAIAFAVPCAAEEIINFTSGQSLPVISHTIEDGMVLVDLGDNAWVAFPEETIESIEIAGKNVMLRPSYGAFGNQRVPTTQGSYPITGEAQARPKTKPIIPERNHRPTPIEIDERTGMAVYRPMGNHPAANKRRATVTGNMKILSDNPTTRGDGQSTYGGTTPLGTRHVIGGIDPRRNNSPRRPDMPKPVSLELRNVHEGPTVEPDTSSGERDSTSGQ